MNSTAAARTCAPQAPRGEEDLAAGRLVMLGPYAKRDARETSRRLRAFLAERPTVLLPGHDDEAASRLARSEVTPITGRRT